MDFWKSILFLLRKKSVGPPVIALSLIVAGLVYSLVPTVYVSTASLVLTAPPAGGTLSRDPDRPGGLTNPLLQFNDALRTTAGILILAMNDPKVQAELGVVEGGPTELVIDDGRTNPELLGISTTGPFIYVEARSTSAATARQVAIRARARIQQELDRRQRALRAPKSTFIWTADVVPPSTPEASITRKLTAAGAGLLVTLFAGFGLAYAVTRIRGARAARAQHPEAVPMPPQGGTPGPERPDAVEPPATDLPAAAPVSASAAGAEEAGASGSAPEPSGDVVTVIRRSDWPEPLPDDSEPKAEEGGRAAHAGDSAAANGASAEPRDWEADTAAWSDEATRELRLRLAAENGEADRRDAGGDEVKDGHDDSFAAVAPGVDKDDKKGSPSGGS